MNHGGMRRGAGRPVGTGNPAGRKRLRSVALRQEMWAWLKLEARHREMSVNGLIEYAIECIRKEEQNEK